MNEPVPTAAFNDPTVLITLLGPDQSGVTTRLFEALSHFDIDVVDVEQLVIRGQLVLSTLVTAPPNLAEFDRTIETVGAEFGLSTAVERGTGDNRPRRVGRARVVVVSDALKPVAVSALAAEVKRQGGNIDRIIRMARYPVTAIRLEVSGADPDVLQAELAAVAHQHNVDLAVQENGILQHAQRLVVMDVDSTLIQGEVIEKLAEFAGCAGQVAEVTDQAMRGELDFAGSLRARVALLAGIDATALDEVYQNLEFTPGARTMIRTLKRLGYRFALVSGGFSQLIEPMAAELGIDYWAANELEIVDGKISGRIVGPVIDRAGKATALREFAAEAGIAIKSTVAIGDGANDLDMLAAAGLGVAFNAKPVVREQAKTSLNVPYLDALVYLLGITREEIEAADAADDARRTISN